jgi:hypothetical protein
LETAQWQPDQVRPRQLGSFAGSWWRSAWSRPLTVAAVVVLFHGLWLSMLLHTGSEPQDFIHIGRVFVIQGHASSAAISAGAAHYRYAPGGIGFDGQFFFYIAVDPFHAAAYLDVPAYRYSRIAYPLLSGALALFDPVAVPWTLLLVNLAMIGAGVLALAAWLRQRGASPWFAAVYGLFPGVMVGFQHDTSEIMSYGLVAVAVYLSGRAQRGRLLATGAVFGLAVLTRETAALFAVVYAAAELLAGGAPWRERARANWRPAALLLTLSLGPYLLLKAVLLAWLRSPGVVPLFQAIPFGGVLGFWPWGPGTAEQVRTIALPAVICAGAAAWALATRNRRVEIWAMLLNALLLVFIGPATWLDLSSSSRIAMGVALSAVLCAPLIARRGWFWASTALWLSPMFVWAAPVAVFYLAALGVRLHL